MRSGDSPLDDERGEELDESLGSTEPRPGTGEMLDESLAGGELPPGHPAGSDRTVGAGETLSGHDTTGSPATPSS